MDGETLKQRLARAIGTSRSLIAETHDFCRDARVFVRDPKRLRQEDAFDPDLLAKLKRDAGERKR